MRSFQLFITFLFLYVLNSCRAIDCDALGFVEGEVDCDICDRFRDIEEIIYKECHSCCTVKEKEQKKLYESAILYADEWLYKARYPMIEEFVKKESKQFEEKGLLTIKSSRGLRPYLKLQDNQGKYSDKIAVENWKTEDIVEFLQQQFKVQI